MDGAGEASAEGHSTNQLLPRLIRLRLQGKYFSLRTSSRTAMVNVTKSNFVAESNDLLRRLPSAAFVAIDEEMTGIMLPNSTRPSKDHTPAQRYQHLRAVPEKYSIIQLGVCLFHQHPDYTENKRMGLPCPEFIARRYNFYMFPPADNRITREVVLNPSSVAFLNQHNMNFDLWSKEGIPYVTEETADEMLGRFEKKQNEKREKASTNSSVGSSPNNNSGRRRVELRRTEDINFHARAMASLREWLDSSQSPPVPPIHPPQDAQEVVSEGLSFLLPPANSFMRRALYESIQTEYPSLVLENAGVDFPNQIRVLRMSPEEKRVREQRLLREDWEDLIVNRIGMWRVFMALSLACQGLQIPFDSITFAENVDGVNWERKSNKGDVEENLVPVQRRIPIVVHNGLMDLLFLMSHFHSHTLPESYADVKTLVHNYFPVIYDTKLLCTECTTPSMWNEFTNLENLYNKVVNENEEMSNVIDLAFDPAIVNGIGNLAGNEEQMHEAAYDAFMTGSVYVGLCRLILSRSPNLFENLDAPVGHAQVGCLQHLLQDERDAFVRYLFGCNRLYLMQSMYTIDLGSKDDPLSRGMTAEAVFRVSGFDPSVTTRTIVQCLTGLVDAKMDRVNFEIVWIDDTTFLVAATRKQSLQLALRPQNAEDDNEKHILQEHGEIVFRALRNRFQRETIERWSEIREKIGRSDLGSPGDGRSWLSRLSRFFRDMFGWPQLGRGEAKKRDSETEPDMSFRQEKRRRII